MPKRKQKPEKRLIGPQLVDRAYRAAGIRLFSDDLAGIVTPGDLLEIINREGEADPVTTIWRHNGDNHRWEIGYPDIDRNTFVVLGSVADEVIEDTLSSQSLAEVTKNMFGSIPPALEDKLNRESYGHYPNDGCAVC